VACAVDEYDEAECSRFHLINSTVSGDTACVGFGCDSAAAGFSTLTNTVIDGVCRDLWVAASNGYNIESPGDTCGFDEAKGDQANVTEAQLDLQPLADNGGPTETHAITTDSAAFNAGTCEVDTDQRGEPRPGGAMCDVGAFEVQP